MREVQAKVADSRRGVNPSRRAASLSQRSLDFWCAQAGDFFRRASDLLADRPALLVPDKARPSGAAIVFPLAGLRLPARLLGLCVRPQPLKHGSGEPHSKER